MPRIKYRTCQLWYCDSLGGTAPIVSMAAADGERISIFPLVCPNKARCVSFSVLDIWFVKGRSLVITIMKGMACLKFGTLLYPDYHSLKLTIYFALSRSLSLWCQIIHKLVFWVGEEMKEIYVLYKNEWPACNVYYQCHPQCRLYSRDGRKRRSSYTYHTWQQS